MTLNNLKTFTIIYSCDQSLELSHEVRQLSVCPIEERVIIPDSFKKGKIIIAVCAGNVQVLNKLGDRAYFFDPENDYQKGKTGTVN